MSKEQFYWQAKEGLLYHTLVNDEYADPFLDTVDNADAFLKNRDRTNPEQEYTGLTLYDTKGRKVKEAVETLSTQSGFDQFTDGGTPIQRPTGEPEAALKHDQPSWDQILDQLHQTYAEMDYLQQNGGTQEEIEQLEAEIPEIVQQHPDYQLHNHM